MITTPEDTNMTEATSSNFRGSSTLRRRLLLSILPAVLLPLAIASTLGYIVTERQAKTNTLERLEVQAKFASNIIATFIRDSFETTDLIASNPQVIQTMKDGSNEAQKQNLIKQSIPSLEQKFADTKLLVVNDSLNSYLKKLATSDRVAEIFLTERNGFNVAYSNLTSDFVQRDEDWWQVARQEGLGMDEPDFDESANETVIPVSQAVKDPQTGEFLGIIQAAIPIEKLSSDISDQLIKGQHYSSNLQIIDPDDSFVLYDSRNEESEPHDHHDHNEANAHSNYIVREVNYQAVDDDDHDDHDDDANLDNIEIVGGKPILEVIETLIKVEGNSLSFEAMEEAEESELQFWSLAEAQKLIAQKPGFSEVYLHQDEIQSETSTVASFIYQNNIYTLSTVPKTDFVSIDVVDYGVVVAEARELLTAFGLTAIILGTISAGLIIILARQITKPLTNLSRTTQEVTQGNLDIKADLEGTLETKTLANNFNQLVRRVKNLLQEQKNLAEQQRSEKEQLEKAIYVLIDEVADATEGDLTVRANLDSMELSTVADLFNAIIDSLQQIALEARHSSGLVGVSLKQNEAEIRALAEGAIAEAKETRDTLMSVQQMSRSIQAVAENANKAEKITDDTYNTIVNSAKNMDLTVDSILQLRTTVGETAKKMKRLGESSQKISQVVSYIEEIALKTNVLAINASVEAGRAGEYGQGFTIVAEQVGALAEQSAAATKEIASIVAAIQAETQEVNQAMESGTTEVVETTRLVESTKESLSLVLEKSQQINQLMESISQSTVSQANTSQNLTSLIQKIAQLSENTSQSSTKVAQSIVETAQVAAKLESTVGQFKVAQ